MTIGNRLREALEILNLNIKESAEKAGIPYRSMQNYLRGEREPGADALTSIGEQLGISIDWLLTGQGEMRKDTASAQGPALSPKEESILALFNALSAADQREILAAAETKKQLKDKLEELDTLIAQHKITG